MGVLTLLFLCFFKRDESRNKLKCTRRAGIGLAGSGRGQDGGEEWFWEFRVKSCGEMGFTINSWRCWGQGDLSACLAVLISCEIC